MNEEVRKRIQTKELTVDELLTLPLSFFLREIGYCLLAYAIIFFPATFMYHLANLSQSIIVTVFIYCIDFILWLGALCIAPLAPLWVTILIQEWVEFGTISYSKAMDQAIDRYIPFAWMALLQCLILIVLYCLLIIPGIIWTIYYLFSTNVVAVTTLGGMEALSYSQSLVKGRWWIVFLTSILINILIWLFILVAWIVFFFLPGLLFHHFLLWSAIGDLFYQMSGPLTAFPIALWFVNLNYLKKDRPA